MGCSGIYMALQVGLVSPLQVYVSTRHPHTSTMDQQPYNVPLSLADLETRKRTLAIILHQRRIQLLTAVALDVALPEKKTRRKRRTWVWPYLQRRIEYGHYDTLMHELYQDNPELYRRMMQELLFLGFTPFGTVCCCVGCQSR